MKPLQLITEGFDKASKFCEPEQLVYVIAGPCHDVEYGLVNKVNRHMVPITFGISQYMAQDVGTGIIASIPDMWHRPLKSNKEEKWDTHKITSFRQSYM